MTAMRTDCSRLVYVDIGDLPPQLRWPARAIATRNCISPLATAAMERGYESMQRVHDRL